MASPLAEDGSISVSPSSQRRQRQNMNFPSVIKKKFPRALLCVGDAQLRYSCMLQLTSSGFVVDECADSVSCVAKWKFPGYHDVVIIHNDLAVSSERAAALASVQMTTATEDATGRTTRTTTGAAMDGLHCAQEIRRLEKTEPFVTLHQNFKNRQKRKDELLGTVPDSIESKTGISRNPFLESAEPELDEDERLELAIQQQQRKGPRTVLIGIFSSIPQRHKMEKFQLFDLVIGMPFGMHVAFFRDTFVSNEELPRLQQAPTYNEILRMLEHVSAIREGKNPAWAALSISDSSRRKSTAVTDGLTPAMGASGVMALQAEVKDLSGQVELLKASQMEAEKETDLANESARKLRAEVAKLTEERIGHLSNISALESMVHQRTQEVEKQRKELAAFYQTVKAVLQDASPQQAVKSKEEREGEDEILNMHYILTQNQQLRDEVFSYQSDVHALQLDVQLLSYKYKMLKKELAKGAKKNDLVTQLSSFRSPFGRETSDESQKQPASPPSANLENVLGENELSLSENEAAGKASPTRALQQVQENAGKLNPRQRLRGSIRAVTAGLKVGKMIERRGSFHKKSSSASDTGGGGGNSAVRSTAVFESYEKELMCLHDEVSREAVHLNYFRTGLLSEKQRKDVSERARWELQAQKEKQQQHGDDGGYGGLSTSFKGGMYSNSGHYENVAAAKARERELFEALQFTMVNDQARSAVKSQWESVEKDIHRIEKVASFFQSMPPSEAVIIDTRRRSLKGNRKRSFDLRGLTMDRETGQKAGMSTAEQEDLEHLQICDSVFQPILEFVGHALTQYRQVIIDCIVSALKLFENEHNLLKQLDDVSRLALMEELTSTAAAEEKRGSGTSPPSGKKGSSASGKGSSLAAEQSWCSTFPKDSSQYSDLASTVSELGGKTKSENGQTKKTKKDDDNESRPPPKADLSPTLITNHLSKHFHHTMRKGLLCLLRTHEFLTARFLEQVRVGSYAVRDLLQPLRLQIQEATDAGRIRPKRNFATQTDAIFYTENGIPLDYTETPEGMDLFEQTVKHVTPFTANALAPTPTPPSYTPTPRQSALTKRRSSLQSDKGAISARSSLQSEKGGSISARARRSSFSEKSPAFPVLPPGEHRKTPSLQVGNVSTPTTKRMSSAVTIHVHEPV